MEEYKLLVAGRRRLKGTITRIVSLAERLPATQSKDGIEVLLERLDFAWSEFEKLGDALSVHDQVDGYVDPDDDNAAYEGRYLRAREFLVSAKRSLEPQTPSTSQCNDSKGNGGALLQLLQQQQQQRLERIAVSDAASTPISNNGVMDAEPMHNELPKIKIKRFAGDYKEWPAFRDSNWNGKPKQQEKAKRPMHAMLAFERGTYVRGNINEHHLAGSADFLAMSVEQRRSMAKEKSVCFNCLRSGLLKGSVNPNSTVEHAMDDIIRYYMYNQLHPRKALQLLRTLRRLRETTSNHHHSRNPSFLMADTDLASVAPIDILVGSDSVWTTLTGKKMHDNMGNLIAISSIFGWVITSVGVNPSPTTTTLFSTCNIDSTLQRFWEIEEVSSYARKDPHKDTVETHFLETHKRDNDGKYIVELPFKTPNPKFADTLQGAHSRFMAVEKRLQRNPDLREKYVKFMQEYLSLGHMTEVKPLSNDSGNLFYLPLSCPPAFYHHHPIVGRKLRVVFDGSFKDANGVALNGTLLIGPSIQRNIFAVYLRFRILCALSGWKGIEATGTGSQRRISTASRILLEDYVDDVLTGANREDELLANKNELLQLMSHAKLDLDKWVSNSSLIYLDWDSELPPNIAEPWLKCRADLDTLRKLQIPRFVLSKEDSIELHAFSDASTKAYAAAVYCRCRNKDGTYSVSLMAAKTRVAPLKQQSLPRLELCGALLLSRLVRSLKEGLRHMEIQVVAWCDSTIVLSWLSYPPSKMKTFVANRTSEILEPLPRHTWHHVSSKENPADCASRGMTTSQLLEFHLWWNGPPWLLNDDEYTAKVQNSETSFKFSDHHAQDELRTTAMLTRERMDDSFSAFDDLVERVSSWQKLVHTVGYVLRFIRRLKKTRNRAESTTLSFEEIKAARLVCLRNAQACFGEDRMLLQTNQPLRNRSQLSKLAPFIGLDDLLRVGGRLRQSKLPEEVKHPILLPKAHRITKLLLEHEHSVNLHPGTSALFVITRQRYWIIGARNLIRKVTHNCIRFFRQRHHTTHQLMADLPSIRITQSLPFVNSGCDYAGPIILKDRKGRNAKKSNGYICLFVCLVTSALHLELATDLSTEAFLAALRRFMSLRGKCAQIYSDNGRNFVGAKRALDEMQQLLASTNHRDLVSQTLADEGINWVFIPPNAPHWGGKWESSVRSVKLHLRRIIGNTILTFEQMHTLLAQISAVVNSRPLYYTPDTDVTCLSPAHLLIGRSFTTIPEGDLSHIPENRLDYWQGVQALYQEFWKRWHQEYLTTLQQRPNGKHRSRMWNWEPSSSSRIRILHQPPGHWQRLSQRTLELTPAKSQSRTNRFVRKAMLSVFRDQAGLVWYELLNPSVTVDGKRYQQQLEELKEFLLQKRPQKCPELGNAVSYA
ncbi:uncharacterized protein [Drosophila bipectinata]|uniref:uncharacterized protein n=1 Tax=Drosophila bipectinata TaxID=42026 RepID=UPI0038B3E835